MRLAKMMTVSAVMMLSVSAVGARIGSAAPAGDDSDLKQECGKLCPKAETKDALLQCVEKQEKKLGEKSFKKKHAQCYQAHEKYEGESEHDESKG